MSADIEFVDPPPGAHNGRRRDGFWIEVAAALAARPDEWAKVASGYESVTKAHRATSGLRMALLRHGLNLSARTVQEEDGTYTLFVRGVEGPVIR